MKGKLTILLDNKMVDIMDLETTEEKPKLWLTGGARDWMKEDLDLDVTGINQRFRVSTT